MNVSLQYTVKLSDVSTEFIDEQRLDIDAPRYTNAKIWVAREMPTLGEATKYLVDYQRHNRLYYWLNGCHYTVYIPRYSCISQKAYWELEYSLLI